MGGDVSKRHLLTTDLVKKSEIIASRHICDISLRLNPLKMNIRLQVHVESVKCMNNARGVWN